MGCRQVSTRKKGKTKAFITPDGRALLPDGRELIERKKAAEILEVSTNTLARMVRDGKLPDLMPEHGTKLILLEDVEALKTTREGKTGSGGDTAEERLVSAQKDRQLANIEKYHARLSRTCADFVLASDADAAAVTILEELQGVTGWQAPFAELLQSGGEEVLAAELRDMLADAQRNLKPFLGGISADPDILKPKDKPGTETFGTITEARAFLEMTKTHLTRIEVAEEAGDIIPAQRVKQEFGDVATTARMQIANVRLRLIPFMRRDDRLELRPAITDLISQVRETVLDLLPEGFVRNAWAKGFEPPEELTASEWADKYRVLSSKTSAEPGRFRTDRTPYMRAIADAIGDDETRRISVRLCAQAGKSELLLTACGFAIDQTPGPMMLVQPTEAMAGDFMRSRVQPMLDTTPRLGDKIKELDERQKGGATSKELVKEFQGGQLVAVGANSPASLASRPIKTLLMDEVDRWPISAGREGSPRLLAERRTQSFLHTCKILAVSTPTVKGESEIDKLFERGSQEYYFAKCPHCGESHIMQFENLRWEDGLPETAVYVAPCCGTLWTDADRESAVLAGEWIASNPAALPEHRSFHGDALVSPFHTHEKMAKEIEEAKGDAMAERTLTNTMRAMSYTDETALLTEEHITNRIENFSLENVPDEVLALCCGIDVQRDRLEAVFIGYGENGLAYVLAHAIVPGSPFDSETWEAADEMLDRRIAHPFGGRLMIDMVAIDSGYATKEVVTWAAQRTNRFAIKGVPGVDQPRWALSKGKKTHAAEIGENLHLVGTFQGKESLLLSLQKRVGDAGSVRIGTGIEAYVDREEFARQLTAEYRRQTPQKNGAIKVEWIRKAGRRSEILDCCVYADAAFSGSLKSRINWQARRERLIVRPSAQREEFASTSTNPNPSTGSGSGTGYNPNNWAQF